MNLFAKAFAFSAILAGSILGNLIAAEDEFDQHVTNIMALEYETRAASCEALTKLCKENHELLDSLAYVALNPEGHVEQIKNARLIIKSVLDEELFVERGVVGFALSADMKVITVVRDGPAMKSGIVRNWQLKKINGKPTSEMAVIDIYHLINGTTPGTTMEMEFLDLDGKKVVASPVIAPRSTVRPDENVEQRKQIFFDEWMEQKKKEIGIQDDPR